MNEMSEEKWQNEICGKGNWEIPQEKPTHIPFCPSRNLHRVTEMQTHDPSDGGEHITACAMGPNKYENKEVTIVIQVNSLSTVL